MEQKQEVGEGVRRYGRWGCWLSISTITSLKKIQHGTKSSVKKDALLPWSQRGRVDGRARAFTPSPRSPLLLLQLPGGEKHTCRCSHYLPQET